MFVSLFRALASIFGICVAAYVKYQTANFLIKLMQMINDFCQRWLHDTPVPSEQRILSERAGPGTSTPAPPVSQSYPQTPRRPSPSDADCIPTRMPLNPSKSKPSYSKNDAQGQPNHATEGLYSGNSSTAKFTKPGDPFKETSGNHARENDLPYSGVSVTSRCVPGCPEKLITRSSIPLDCAPNNGVQVCKGIGKQDPGEWIVV
ncbi:hypothetical protein F5Y08DRAFT_344159 [Xylaria arbuscula]|nr:hypothetical protein F5Y08DRAFT_344159 [Xylaria arbuscula]